MTSTLSLRPDAGDRCPDPRIGKSWRKLEGANVLLGGDGPDGFALLACGPRFGPMRPRLDPEELYVAPPRRGEGLRASPCPRRRCEPFARPARSRIPTSGIGPGVPPGSSEGAVRKLRVPTNREGGPTDPIMLYYELEARPLKPSRACRLRSLVGGNRARGHQRGSRAPAAARGRR